MKNRKLKVLVSGGGTGGHIFPAVAIANAIKKEYPDSEIEFVGAKGRMEMDKVPAEGYKIHGLWISGLQRSFDLQNFLLPLKLLSSLWKSFVLVKRFKPDVTIGVGGYASGPLNFVASSLGVPLLLQEQNSFPGITNKLLKNKAQVICVAYPGMDRFFPAGKIVLTGNPIRHDLLEYDGGRDKALEYFNLSTEKKTILIIGGSLGARSVNQAVEELVREWGDDTVQLLWQTGKSYTGKHGIYRWGVSTEFIKRMDLAYQAADIVVSRAGAISISELSALHKACIFVPLPSAAEDHQTKNAQSLVDKGAAMLCKDKELKEKLGDMMMKLVHDDKRIQELKTNIRAFEKRDAAQEILKEIEKILE